MQSDYSCVLVSCRILLTIRLFCFLRLNQKAVVFSCKTNRQNSCKRLVGTLRHHPPDCPHTNTTRDLWHLVCIQRSTPRCPHSPTNPVHLMNLFIKPGLNWHLVDWVGCEVMQCECQARAAPDERQKTVSQCSWVTGRMIGPAIKNTPREAMITTTTGVKQKIWTYKGSGECLSWIISRMNSYQLPLRTNALLKVSVQPKQWYPVSSPLRHNQDGMGFHSSF